MMLSLREGSRSVIQAAMAVLVLGLACQTVRAQFDCAAPPWRAMVQDSTNCDDFATDCGIAVSSSRIVLTSNCTLQILEKSCGTLQDETFLWDDASDALFILTEDDYKVFDPSVIYDPLGDPADPSPVFWIVASERGQGGEVFDTCRIRIAVSTTDAPDDWDTAGGSPTWHVYNYDLRAEEPINDPEPTGFAERPTFVVDEDYLYVVFEDANGTPNNDRSMVAIFPKDDLMTGTKGNIVKTMFIDDDNNDNGLTTLHQFAAIDDLTDDDENRVYIVATEDHPRGTDLANIQENIVLGCVFWDGDSWEFERELLDVYGPGYRFRGVTGSTFGSPTTYGDFNPLIFSIFFDASHREGEDTVWTAHHVRKYPPLITEPNRSYVQWYAIDLDGWPVSGPPSVSPALLSPSGGDWLHDVSVGVNEGGVVGLGFLSSDDDQYPHIESYVKNGANTLWTDHVTSVACWITSNNDWIDFSA